MTARAPTPCDPATTYEGVDPMGRGRAKAKQTKVARELKYRSYDTDFSELQRELHGDHDNGHVGSPKETDTADSSDEYDDPYADLYDDDAESANQR
jgi:Protein of unknown function (DUF3073)